MADRGVPGPATVDPAEVPTRMLRDGSTMPAIGFGTFGSDHVAAESVARSVGDAIRAGYRLIDCAEVYGNEAQIGQALAETRDAIRREDLFVVSKVWNDHHAPADLRGAAEATLRHLRLDYLDAYLVHWPFSNSHPPLASSETRHPDAGPFVPEQFLETWAAMEALVDDGLVRHLGTSNMTVAKLDLVLPHVRRLPDVNEMELHPCFQQGELFQYCVDHGIVPIGYSPLGSPSRPERDRTDGDVSDIDHPVVLRIAADHGIHPVSVCLKWAVQRGQVPIPFSTDAAHLAQNLRSVVGEPLTRDEMHDLRGIDRNSRLIKGQVFLWPEATSWLDLWDVEGQVWGR